MYKQNDLIRGNHHYTDDHLSIVHSKMITVYMIRIQQQQVVCFQVSFSKTFNFDDDDDEDG